MYDFELYKRKFTFTFQPIVQLDSNGNQKRIVAHEMLLRDMETGGFPIKFFQEQLKSEKKIRQLCNYYTEMITRYFNEHEHTRLNINIDPKQLFLKETYHYFNKLIPFANRITIELTEEPIVDGVRSIDYLSELTSAITHIHHAGFLVALDDVGTGENTLELAEKLTEKVDLLKFTTIPFRNTTADNGLNILSKWRSFSQEKEIPLVIEGIETREQATIFSELGHDLQQGYYWNE